MHQICTSPMPSMGGYAICTLLEQSHNPHWIQRKEIVTLPSWQSILSKHLQHFSQLNGLQDPSDLWNAEVEQTNALFDQMVKKLESNCLSDNNLSSVYCAEAERDTEFAKQMPVPPQPEPEPKAKPKTGNSTISAKIDGIMAGTPHLKFDKSTKTYYYDIICKRLAFKAYPLSKRWALHTGYQCNAILFNPQKSQLLKQLAGRTANRGGVASTSVAVNGGEGEKTQGALTNGPASAPAGGMMKFNPLNLSVHISLGLHFFQLACKAQASSIVERIATLWDY